MFDLNAYQNQTIRHLRTQLVVYKNVINITTLNI